MLQEKIQSIIDNTPDSIFEILPEECFKRHDINDYVYSWHNRNKELSQGLSDNGGKPCFETYYALAKVLNPKSFLEIGVRFGYSFIPTLIGGNEIEYALGLDLETYGNNAIANSNIKEFYKGNATWELKHLNSQEIIELPQFFDLVSIDGCHNYHCKIHDLKLAMNNSTYVIIDDYIYHYDVRRATDDFLKEFSHNIENALYLDTFRGSMLIEFKNKVEKVKLEPTDYND